MRNLLVAVLLIALPACLDTSAPRQTITLDFDMTVVGENWVAEAADFDVGREADVQLVGELRSLPAPLDPARLGIYLAGTNLSDDLFIFTKKLFAGLAPNETYTVSMAVEIASDIHADCNVGTGPLVWIKAGAMGTEPRAVQSAGRWITNFDRGDQDQRGEFTQLGDIRNTIAGCPASGTWGIKGTVLQPQTHQLTTDAEGNFWIWLGTESGFESRHELFFDGFRLQLTRDIE